MHRSERRDATYQSLIAHARTRFAQQGFPAVSLARIVADAGLTKGALYHHFASKGELFEAVLEQVQQEVGERVAAAAEAAAASAEEVLERGWVELLAGCEAFLDVATEEGTRQILLVDGPAVVGWSRWRDLDEANSARHLEEAVTALQATGAMTYLDPRAVTLLLSGALNEAALWIAHSADRKRDLASAMTTLTAMLEGVRRPTAV
ncbi:TetR/AcrR family transcriptional regulator [Microbacterium proteolyticum]|jgi:AcrR family transcriptional regulator|uniref:TetR/AcrR family transcriptional regulator n=1 Tax=Microbacterium proteolyticum TaxID=1572644 RepID=UPI001FAD1F8B|nr:TetR/AcrR family transcriptional regulator [Microbacterium proteolyticum]MCI9856948.1 TetR/AcrR family transcriptional regulator [Microbacterium proteolyticum]